METIDTGGRTLEPQRRWMDMLARLGAFLGRALA
jgi:hypothetical protein